MTNYSYDMLDHLTQVSMTRGSTTQTRTFAYNANQQLQSATNPETGTVTYLYNVDGSVASKTDAKNQKAEYSYDAYRRVTQSRKLPNGLTEDLCQRVDYSYDINPYDPSYSSNTWGRVAAVQYGGESCVGGLFQEWYDYTAAGLATKKKLRFRRYNTWHELESTHSYNTDGKMTSVSYPGYWVDTPENGETFFPGPAYTYAFDAMGRPNKLTRTGANPIDWVKDVTYNATGAMTQIKYVESGQQYWNYLVESRTYNNRLQMTRQTVAGTSGNADWEYRYAANQNDGRVTQIKDWVTGEEVGYQYDSLSRLISAVTTGPEWGLSFTYDGFGNRTGQNVTKGSAPAMNLTYNGLTNRVNTTHGFQYDANGNVTVMPNLTNTFDAANRLTQVAHTSNGTEQHAYAPDNKRIWSMKPPAGNDVFYYHDVMGQRLGTYSLNWQNKVRLGSMNLYFGSKMVVSEGKSVVVDRLGSVRLRETVCCLPMDRMSYFPYGEERTTTYFAGDKFGTYKRDGHSGLDYADQRYYASLHGRFLTVDPYVASAEAPNPNSWNRYSYVEGDPVNWRDPRGLMTACPEGTRSIGEGEGCLMEDVIETGPVARHLEPGQTGGSSGGGGGSRPSNEELLGESFIRIMETMTDDCAKAVGGDTIANVRNMLGNLNIGLGDLGRIAFSDGQSTGGPLANTFTPDRRVTLNSQINWHNPSRTNASIDGQPRTYDLLAARTNDLNRGFAASGSSLRVNSIAPSQLMDLTLLHELSHNFGQNYDGSDYRLWEPCFRN